jgi:hypothetical protein
LALHTAAAKIKRHERYHAKALRRKGNEIAEMKSFASLGLCEIRSPAKWAVHVVVFIRASIPPSFFYAQFFRHSGPRAWAFHALLNLLRVVSKQQVAGRAAA